MDKKKVVEKVRKTLREYSKGKNYSLVMILQSEPFSMDTKWNLIISAPWLDNKERKPVLVDLLGHFKNNLDKSDMRNLSRISLVKSTDKFVKTMNVNFDVEDEALEEINNANINGAQVERAFILESRNLLATA